AARRFFQELRQLFITWNSLEWQSEAFKAKEKEFQAKLEKNTKQEVGA
ncbi:hypothetical protein MHK_005438, partial [Candidatus Magnetomorum sp. HK-1]